MPDKPEKHTEPESGRADAPAAHFWDYCDLCETWMVVCGKCGNNCCNAGYGTLPDGSECDACPSAYAMEDSLRSTPGASTTPNPSEEPPTGSKEKA